MNREQMLLEVNNEIERLQKIAALLRDENEAPRRGSKAEITAIKAHAENPGKRKRTMSAEARERIAEAQRKRWAKFKKAKKA